MYVLITTLWCNKDGEFWLPSKAPLREVARLRLTARRLRRRIVSHLTYNLLLDFGYGEL